MAMINIIQAESNTVILTLTEKTTIDNPNYLFRLTSDQQHEDYCFIAADTSLFKDRYNEFLIIETTDPDNLNGEVYLPVAGDYHYTVYQQASSTNLNPSLSGDIVEIGRCKVHPASDTSDTSYSGTLTNNVYNG
jgi:hypothetical protein